MDSFLLEAGRRCRGGAGVAEHHPVGDGMRPVGDAGSAGRASAVIAGAGPAVGAGVGG
jgi:hypothetical protein